MTRRGSGCAIGAGILLALILVLAASVLAVRAGDGRPIGSTRDARGVLVALVLPDAAGAQDVRLMVYYPPGSAVGIVVDPSDPAVVPGTSARTLAGAFTFGGGDLLARTWAEKTDRPVPAWVVVDEPTWLRIADGPVTVALGAPVDVFDGTDLVTFPAGSVSVAPRDLGVLLAGMDASASSERRSVMGEAAEAVQRALGDIDGASNYASDLGRLGLRRWLQSLPSRAQPTTATP